MRYPLLRFPYYGLLALVLLATSRPLAAQESVVIAIIDTGINYSTAPELREFEWTDLNGKQAPHFHFGTDGDDHGTRVATTMRQIIQTHHHATDLPIQFMSMRILGSNLLSHRVLDAHFRNALSYAIENKADVINISLQLGRPSESTLHVIQNAAAQGIMMVAGAGNDSDIAASYPAALGEMMAVGALQNGKRAPKSNFGLWVDLSAPATYTSFAAAQVSAAAALLKARHPHWKAQEIERALYQSADRLPGYFFMGRGRLNTDNALNIQVPTPIPFQNVFIIEDADVRNEGGSPFQFIITRRGNPSGEIQLPYKTVSLTAENDKDFIAHDHVLTWKDGDRSNKTIVVEMINDKYCEPLEQFEVHFQQPSNAIFIGETIRTQAIADFGEKKLSGIPRAQMQLTSAVDLLRNHERVHFPGFLKLAAAFGSKPGDAHWNPIVDLDQNGAIEFTDFLRLSAPGQPLVPFNATPSQDPEGYLTEYIIKTQDDQVLYQGTSPQNVFTRPAGTHDLQLIVKDQCGHESKPFWFSVSIDQMSASFNLTGSQFGEVNTLVAQPRAPVSMNTQSIVRPQQGQVGRLHCALDKPKQVQILIYDQLGRQVRHLVNQHMRAGDHAIEWDGRNDSGALLGSGTYFVSVKMGDQNHKTKFVLIR